MNMQMGSFSQFMCVFDAFYGQIPFKFAQSSSQNTGILSGDVYVCKSYIVLQIGLAI